MENASGLPATFQLALVERDSTEHPLWRGILADGEVVKFTDAIFRQRAGYSSVTAWLERPNLGEQTFSGDMDYVTGMQLDTVAHHYRLTAAGLESSRRENAFDVAAGDSAIAGLISLLYKLLSCADLSPADAVRRYPPEAAAASAGG